MKITEREKTILIAGAIVAVFIVLIAPLVRKWNEMGERLEPKLEYVAVLKERVQGQDSLLSRRNALVRRLGSLTGTDEPGTEKDKSDKEVESSKEEENGEKEKEGKATEAEKDEKESEVNAAGEKKEGNEETVEEPPKVHEKDGEGAEAEESAPEEKAEDDGGASGGEDEKAESELTSGEDEKEKDGKTEESAKEDEAGGEAEQSREGGEKVEEGEGPSAKEKGASADDAGESEEKKGQLPEHVRLAAYVERMAQQSGMKFKRVTPKRAAAGAQASKSFDAAAVQFSVEGNIRNLVKMLHALEKGQRFVRVEQMQVQRNLERGGTVEASLDVMAYEAKAR